MKKALIIGGGFAGCAAAHQIAQLKQGWDVTIIESAPFLGAGVRTQWWGGHPYTFGPRHFLTTHEREHVYRYLDAIVPLRLCPEHEFLTYVERDGNFYNFPINMADIQRMPDREQILAQLKTVSGVANAKTLEEYWIGSVGRILFDKFINTYNQKMWMVKSCHEIDTFNWSPKGVAIKDGKRACWDAFISGFPKAPDGYNAYFDFATKEANVLLNTSIEQYDIPHRAVVFNGERRTYDIVVSTTSLDVLFDRCYGELPFLGRDFHKLVFPVEHVFPENVYFLYYANEEQFTRMVEYKQFYRHKAPTTLVGLEIPSFKGKHYPLPFKKEQAKHNRYKELLPERVFSIGRAGKYDYSVDIDDCIVQAMDVAKAI